MDKSIAFILSLSVFIPLITGLVRYGELPVSYFPLIYLLGIGLINEVVSYLFFYNSTNAIPTNIYFLVEFFFFIWQFRAWKNIIRKNWVHRSLLIVMTAIWVIENVILGRLDEFSPFFQVIYSMLLILLAVNQLNWLLVNERGDIVTNPIFIICIAIIIFYSYKVLTEVFYFYAPENLMKNNIFVIESYVNVGYNVLLAIAILCIPQRRNFIQPSQ
jgi:hypothetical protein